MNELIKMLYVVYIVVEIGNDFVIEMNDYLCDLIVA